MASRVRLTEMDLLRFLAAVGVMLFHYRATLKSTKVLFQYGYMGIFLFFIISGFVILMSSEGRSSKEFLVSRMVRLCPSFWACSTLTYLFMSYFHNGYRAFHFWIYLVNLTILPLAFHVRFIDLVYWTLAIEIKFYFYIWALIGLKQVGHLKRYLFIWLIISIIYLIWPFVWLKYIFTADYSAFFIAGAAFYLIYKHGSDWNNFFLIIASYILAIFQMIKDGEPGSGIIPLNIDLYIVVLGFFYMIFTLIAFNKTAFLRSDKFLILGFVSYPLYLLHNQIGHGLMVMNKHLVPSVLFVLTSVSMLFLAYLVHIAMETQFAVKFRSLLESALKIRR